MIKAKKHLGQHFLADKNIAIKIVDSLQNLRGLPVLEVGPGTGVLTTELVKKDFDLNLVEIDTDMVCLLKEKFGKELNLINADFLKIDLKKIFSSEFCIIGNFPYNISSQIFFKTLDNVELIPELVCMIQKEVAERIASKHGNKTYGILSVLLQLFYKIEYLFVVNENVFIPPPKVKSSVIRLTRYRTEIEGVDKKQLFLVVKTAFNQRRKTLRNSLKPLLNEKVDTTNKVFNLRPEQLSPEDFVSLTKMIFKDKKMFVSDFDGTIANNSSVVSENTINLLKKLEEISVLRVIATGRSLFSFTTVVKQDFPIDYLVFSSGIGIYDWKTKKIIQSSCIGSEQTKKVYDYLVENNYDFMVQLPVPDNHYFHHFSSDCPSSDFLTRVKFYETKGLEPISECPETASQFVVICSEENGQMEKISKKFPDLKVVKATSPLDNKSIWIEILPYQISKASGIEFIRQLENIEHENIVTVGNDYYDLDMLNYSVKENSYLVENSPDEIKDNFNIIASNENEGVAKLLQRIYSVN